MNKNKLRVLELIMGMWENDLIKENGTEDFENWCEDNIDNEEQREFINKVKAHVDAITNILDEEI